jgi:hypothetical protein
LEEEADMGFGEVIIYGMHGVVFSFDGDLRLGVPEVAAEMERRAHSWATLMATRSGVSSGTLISPVKKSPFANSRRSGRLLTGG